MVKSILTYLFLVGVPLVGLLWILDYGGQRIAPHAISGSWQVEGSLAGCLDEQPADLAFQQSGRFVQVSIGGARGEARLDGEQLHASVVESNGPCSSVAIEGSFESGAEGSGAERFTGQLTGNGCDACRGVELVAQRIDQPVGK